MNHLNFRFARITPLRLLPYPLLVPQKARYRSKGLWKGGASHFFGCLQGICCLLSRKLLCVCVHINTVATIPKIAKPRTPSNQNKQPQKKTLMLCAKGIFAKGIWGCMRFPLCSGKTPYIPNPLSATHETHTQRQATTQNQTTIQDA